MLVQLNRHLRELRLPFQSLSRSQYVQVPSRYQIVSHVPILEMWNALLSYIWVIQSQNFVSGSTPMCTS
jgi:hypothetical protein